MLPLSDLMYGVPPQNLFQKGGTRTRATRLSLDLGARLKHKLDNLSWSFREGYSEVEVEASPVLVWFVRP